MPTPIQIVDNLALVPLTASEVANLNLQSMGVITITAGLGVGDMLKSTFATLNPGAGYVDKSLAASTVPYTGITQLPGGTTTFLRADGVFATTPDQVYTVATTAGPGLVPALPASSGFSYFMRGDGSWQLISSLSIAYSQLTGIPLTFTPIAHATQHITGGNDVIPSATGTKSGLVPILPASNQTTQFHRGDNAWAAIPAVSTLVPGLAPILPGTTTTFLRGDGSYTVPVYAQLSGVPSTFTPTAHATQHITGGNDIIPNFSSAGGASGLTPPSVGGTVNFLRADGVWAAPTGSGGLASSSQAGLISQLPASNQTTYFARGDNSWQLISTLSIAYAQVTGVPVFAGGSAGLVPNSVGGTVNFLRADGVYAAPAGGTLASSSGAGLIAQLPASAQATYFARGDNSWQLISSMTFAWTQITSGIPASFNPSSHATTHITGGSDVIPAPTVTKSGLVPILPSASPTLNFLRGDATWAVIPIATATTGGLIPTPPNQTNQWLRGDSTFSQIPTVSSSVPGLVPAFPANTTTFFRGDGTYSQVTYASLTGTPATFAPAAHATQHITAGNDIVPNFTATASGLVPLSGGGTSNFLRSDGTWQTPSGAGDVAHTRAILTINSITGGGDLSADRTHQLVNDVASPGNWQLYSTNGSGVRGWNASTALPQATNLVAGLVPTPPNNAAQFLSGAATFVVPPAFTNTTPGYAPLSGGGTTNFLRADGTWSAPPSSSLATTSAGGIVPQLPASAGTTYYLRGDNSWQLVSGLSIAYSQLTGVPVFSGTATAGLVPGSAGGATQFLRADGTFNIPPLAGSGTPGYISGLPAPANATAFFARGDNSWQLLPLFNLVTTPWTMPAVGSTVSGVVLLSTAIFTPGMTIFTGSGATSCLMEVDTVTDATHLILRNRGNSFNPSTGTSIPGSLISIEGPGIMTNLLSGLVPTPPNDSTKFLRGDATWSVPPGGGSGTILTQFSVTGDGSSGSKVQLVNDTANPGAFSFYSTDASGTRGWFPLTFSWETAASFVMPGIGATQNVLFNTTADMELGTTIVIEDNTVPTNQGFFEVVSINGDGVHAVIRNPGYVFNSAPGLTFATNASVTLAGPATASASAPGFVPLPPNNTVTFLRGDATFSTPANVTTGAPGYVPTAPNDTTKFLRGDASWAVPSLTTLASTGVQGAVVGLPASNQATSFLRGDNSWQLISSMAIAYSQLTGTPSTFAPSAHASSHISTGADVIPLFSTGSSTSGLVPGSVTGGTSNYLRADGNWATPPSAGLATTSVDGLLKGLPASAQTTYYLRGDNTWQLISGLAIAYSQLTGVPSTFTPSAHASSHLDNGADAIAVVAGLRTGLVPVLPAAAPTTKFLRGDATWTVIPTVTSGAAGLAPAFPNNTTTYLRGDGTYAAVPTATATTGGLVPVPPNLTYQWLRGDATWVTIPFYWNISASFTQPAISGTVSATFTSTTGLQAAMCIATIDGSGLTNCYQVQSVTDATHAVLVNLGAQGNTAAASTVNVGQANLNGPPVMTATGAGIVPVPPNDNTKFLRGDGTWAVPPASGVTTARQIATQYSLTGGGDLSADRTLNLVNDTAAPGSWQIYSTNGSGTRGWNAGSSFPVATTSNAGLLLTLAGGTTTFLRADGTWAAPSSLAPASTGVAGTVVGLPASNQTTQWLRADNSWQFLSDTNATTASWVMPAVGSTVSGVTFVSTSIYAVGMTLFFATGATATECFMEVDTVTDATHLVLRNRGYGINPASTTTIPTSLATISAHGVATATTTGFVPLPPNNTTTFLRGDATFAALPANSTSVAGTVAASPNDVNKFYRGDSTWDFPPVSTETNGTFTVPGIGSTVAVTVVSAAWTVVGQTLWISDGTNKGFFEITVRTSATAITVKNQGYSGNSTSGTMATASIVKLVGPSIATATQPGFLPLPPNNTTTFLRGDATFVAVAYSSLTGTPSTFAPSAHASTHLDNGTDPIAVVAGSRTGLVPVLPSTNPTDKWLRGDATWVSSPSLAITTVATFTWPAAGGTVAIQVDSSALMKVGMALYFPALGVAELTVVTDATHITIRNNGNSGNAGSTAGVAVGTQIFVGGGGALASATTSGDVPVPPNNTTTFLRGDASFATPPTATATTPGYVSPPNNTALFLRGDATWTASVYSGQATVNFGATDTGDDSVASTTVTATWLSASNYPQVTVYPGSDHADEDAWVENISAYIINPVIGSSFDIVLHAPTGAVGNYLVNYISN